MKIIEFKNINNIYLQNQNKPINVKKINPKYPNCYTNMNNKVIFTEVENTQDLIINQKE